MVFWGAGRLHGTGFSSVGSFKELSIPEKEQVSEECLGAPVHQAQHARDYTRAWMVHASHRMKKKLGLQLLAAAWALWRPQGVPGT